MTGLPGGLTEPLHLLEPFASWPWVAFLVLTALANLLWRRKRRRPAPQPPAAAPPRAPSTTFADRVRELLKRFRYADPRRGCHEISELVREHLELLTGEPFTRWTAGEAKARTDDAAARLLDLLAGLQFGRRDPRPSDLQGLGELAIEVVQAASSRRNRRGGAGSVRRSG